ncbi:hypothetical protein O181_104080 [Austropuccinia psidii MF-1]|uniref:PFU domain-containing protein n=1 Tax=Austropuccinia psidii MF-1 TaxID=1389203 RepID=A0A9Q3PKC2_9BASI|nr:hypothetical protein [Austropuccinia psidii MF-1]
MNLLSQKGKKEGEVAMAKNESNGAIEAYQWDGTKGDWSMVGTFVYAIGSSRKKLFEGKEVNYVFDVDIQDGVPPLKLPYNIFENPYTVAQKWLAKHQLPDSYVEKVVQFIDKNTSGVAIGSQSSGADLLAGANSYQPNSSQATNTSSSARFGKAAHRKLWVDTSPQFNMNTKNTKVAVATLLLNLSIIHLESGLDHGLSSRILTIMREGLQVPPTYTNITDASISFPNSNATPTLDLQNPPSTHLFLNNAGCDKFIFACTNHANLVSWVTAIGLASWERSRSFKIYTSVLLALHLPTPQAPSIK